MHLMMFPCRARLSIKIGDVSAAGLQRGVTAILALLALEATLLLAATAVAALALMGGADTSIGSYAVLASSLRNLLPLLARVVR